MLYSTLAGVATQVHRRCAEAVAMDGIARLWRALQLHQDPLADFRERIAARLSLFAAILLLPFVLNHLLPVSYTHLDVYKRQ